MQVVISIVLGIKNFNTSEITTCNDSSGSIMVPDESVKVDAVFVCQSASTLPCIWSNIVLFLDQMQVVWIDRNRFVWIDPHLMLHMAPYAALEPISPIAARAANDGDIGPIGPIVIGPINVIACILYVRIRSSTYCLTRMHAIT